MTRTCIIHGDGERIVLRDGEVDRFFKIGREHKESNSPPDMLEVARAVKGET